MNDVIQRRAFLKWTGTAGLGAMVMAPSLANAVGQVCKGLTPPQTRGPFYPGENSFTLDQDLTQVPGSATRAAGQVIYVKGKVLDDKCRPIKNANVEIWQACESGSYNHDRDPNPAPRDPNFRYWAECFTNEEGEYWFKTILPGAYPATESWKRPPHIHFRVARLGFHELVTQMYFKGDPLNDADLILQSLSVAERASVEISFRDSPADFEPGSK